MAQSGAGLEFGVYPCTAELTDAAEAKTTCQPMTAILRELQPTQFWWLNQKEDETFETEFLPVHSLDEKFQTIYFLEYQPTKSIHLGIDGSETKWES